MEGCFLDCFRKTVNVRNVYDNGGGYFHQSNDMVRDFYLYLSDSKTKHGATTTAHLYILLDRILENKNEKRWDNAGSNICMRK